MGQGKALDPEKLFLATTSCVGNGSSSSAPDSGDDGFGTMWDAVHRPLTEDLKAAHLKAVIGFSMGAQQAFQWAVSYPRFEDKVVAIGDGEDVWAWDRATGGGDRGDHCG